MFCSPRDLLLEISFTRCKQSMVPCPFAPREKIGEKKSGWVFRRASCSAQYEGFLIICDETVQQQ